MNFVDLRELNDFFESNPLTLLQFNDDFDYLVEKGFLIKATSRTKQSTSIINFNYSINEVLTKAILQNQSLPTLKKIKYETPIEIIEEIYKAIEFRRDNDFSTFELVDKVQDILDKNAENLYAQLVLKENLPKRSASIFTYMVWKSLLGTKRFNLTEVLESIYGENSTMLNSMQHFIDGSHVLVTTNMVEVQEENFFNEVEAKLTDKSVKLLGEIGIKINKRKTKSKNIIFPEDIKEKQLYYNNEELKQVNTLQKMLEETTFQQTRERLEAKKLPRGIVALFYGPPGTGKTESVLQMAKATGRDIFKVDISETKSMWFGQSEKLIKRIFDDYRDLCENCKLKPILFFNEADAIISSRKEGNGSAVDQTLNTIQNIILEELENFDGILIATTNLEGNMDSAFERRFLFKVKMDKPTPEVKAKIWLEKMEGLTQAQAIQLSQMFDFSGGQIDNIFRKKEIEEIVHGKTISFEEILSFCGQENLSKSNISKVGFSI